MLREVIGRFPLPLHLVAGNSDRPGALRGAFAGSRFFGGGELTHYTVDYPEATVVVLDSTLAAHDRRAGGVGRDQLAWLDRVLSDRPAVPAFVCLHHPPVPAAAPLHRY